MNPHQLPHSSNELIQARSRYPHLILAEPSQEGRMPQMWCLLAPLLEQKQHLHIGMVGGWEYDMDHFLGKQKTFDAFAKLARPDLREQTIATETCPHHRSQTARLSLLESLPSELLDMIMCQAVMSYDDVISLGSSSTLLWRRVVAHVKADVRNSMGPWAGTPLICTGTWLRDLPSAFHEAYPQSRGSELVPSPYDLPIRAWNWQALKHYSELEYNDVGRLWLDGLHNHLSGKNTKPTVAASMKSAIEEAIHVQAKQAGQVWQLRNLSTKQFFKLEFNSAEESTAHVVNAPWLSLDTALLIRIFWSGPKHEDERSSRTSWDDSLKRGIWAAHRFDVVLQPIRDPSDWKDVTDAVIGDAMALGLPRKPPLSSKKSTALASGSSLGYDPNSRALELLFGHTKKKELTMLQKAKERLE